MASKNLRTNKIYLIFNVICAIMIRDIITLLSKTIVRFFRFVCFYSLYKILQLKVVIDGTSTKHTIEQSNNWPCQLMSFLIQLSENFILVSLLWLVIYLFRKLKAPSTVKVTMCRAVVIGTSKKSCFAYMDFHIFL
jgi:hypothetical protein